MRGIHPESGPKSVLFALILEVLFLGLCSIFVGYGLSEMKKRKRYAENLFFVLLGFILAGVSLYVTKLLIQG